MWYSSVGKRTLSGIEAVLFTQLATHHVIRFCTYLHQCGLDNRDIDEDTAFIDTGIRVLNDLSVAQQVAVMDETIRAMLTESLPAPELTACNEAVIFSLYGYLDSLQHFHPDLYAQYRKQAEEFLDSENVPEDIRQNIDDFAESMVNRILWDRAFLLSDILSDESATSEEMFAVKLVGRTQNAYYNDKPTGVEDAEQVLNDLYVFLNELHPLPVIT